MIILFWNVCGALLGTSRTGREPFGGLRERYQPGRPDLEFEQAEPSHRQRDSRPVRCQVADTETAGRAVISCKTAGQHQGMICRSSSH